MTSEILTPVALWEDFKIEHQPKIEPIAEYVDGDITISRFYLYGRQAGDEYVKIYCALAKNNKLHSMPGAFVVQDFSLGANEDIISKYAKDGYAAFTFCVGGDDGERGNHTIYPKSLSHVNYVNCQYKLMHVEGSIKQSCWYEWGVTSRYALDYFTSLPFVKSVGVIGLGEVATVLWQIVASQTNINCAVFVKNAGWKAYRDNFKFGNELNSEFSDETLKYLAGVEPQTYAPHVKCPTLVLACTNDRLFDCDRAYDTVSRIPEEVYTAIDYSVNCRNAISIECFMNIKMFFDKYVKGKEQVVLPNPVDISGEIVDGKLCMIASPMLNDLKEVVVYVAEGKVNPSFRAWQVLSDGKRSGDCFEFSYTPYAKSGLITFFAKAIYKNKTSVCSPILCKKFNAEDVKEKYSCNVIYSSRIENNASLFTSMYEKGLVNIPILSEYGGGVKETAGPLGIEGLTSQNGLLTFSVGTPKYTPKEDAMFMLDVFVKEQSDLTVGLSFIEDDNVVNYFAKLNLMGGKGWHNVRLNKTDFKSVEGRTLKSYENLCALIIDCKGEYLVNNLLWV